MPKCVSEFRLSLSIDIPRYVQILYFVQSQEPFQNNQGKLAFSFATLSFPPFPYSSHGKEVGFGGGGVQ